MSEKRNSGECRLFWILVHLGPRRCVGPREIRLAPHLRGGEHEERQSGERIVLALDVQVCDQDEPADDGLVPDAGFARTRAGNATTTITPGNISNVGNVGDTNTVRQLVGRCAIRTATAYRPPARHADHRGSDQHGQPDQPVFGDDAGIRAHRPHRVRVHAGRESRGRAAVHAKTVQQPSGFGRAGPHRIDDVARAITGEQRPRMGEQSAYRIEALVDPREERAVSLGPVFRDGGESGIRQHTQQAQCKCAENLQHAPDAACAVMPIGARHKGDQQRHDGIDDDSGAGLHEHRADGIRDDEVTQPFGVDAVAPAHEPHERKQYAEQVHADIAGLGEQELRTAAAPHRVVADVLPVHEVREIVGQRFGVQTDGQPLHDAHSEGNPV
ncbi:hypothetical protein CE165_04865 [Bifidobacterium longum]|nr:hypothetical protein CE171_00505 [Bifidobacterium longum]RDX09387.1 hypothetical protein CE165_04865 [Bifidobacterium longum]